MAKETTEEAYGVKYPGEATGQSELCVICYPAVDTYKTAPLWVIGENDGKPMTSVSREKAKKMTAEEAMAFARRHPMYSAERRAAMCMHVGTDDAVSPKPDTKPVVTWEPLFATLVQARDHLASIYAACGVDSKRALAVVTQQVFTLMVMIEKQTEAAGRKMVERPSCPDCAKWPNCDPWKWDDRAQTWMLAYACGCAKHLTQ